MQFLTSRSLIYIRVILLLTAGFWIATDPKTLVHSNFVLLLGEAMRLPIIPVYEKSPYNGIIGLFLGLFAITDLIPCIADNIQYFETIVPTRLFVYFMFSIYAYLIEDRVLSNSVTFVYSFVEIWINLLIYNNLRDEKYHRLKDYINENAEELQKADGEEVRVIEDYD